MRYKTLFRVLLKVLGVWLIASSTSHLFNIMAIYAAFPSGYAPVRRGTDWVVNVAPDAMPMLIGLYLFFGGKWIADLAIPGNRPYCPECGYDLTGATESRCPECGTPFSSKDVLPGSK